MKHQLETLFRKGWNKLADPWLQRQSVQDVAEYLQISVDDALNRARVKDTPEEDALWKDYQRKDKSDYRDYYSKNLHYLERQDWYNRTRDLAFLKWIPQGGHALDYGCGTGYVLFRAWKKRSDIHLHMADIPEALTKAFALWRLRKHSVKFDWYDIPQTEELTYSQPLDFIRCHDVLEHTFHPDKVLKGFWTALRPGGVLSFDYLEDDEFRKENTREAQKLREECLNFVRRSFEFLRENGNTFLVRKR